MQEPRIRANERQRFPPAIDDNYNFNSSPFARHESLAHLQSPLNLPRSWGNLGSDLSVVAFCGEGQVSSTS